MEWLIIIGFVAFCAYAWGADVGQRQQKQRQHDWDNRTETQKVFDLMDRKEGP